MGDPTAWPPGHGPWIHLPLIVMLHGEGAKHTNALTGMTPAQAVALEVGGKPLPPMAMVTVDGGPGDRNPHPGDDPMAMVVDELIPMCQGLGLGQGRRTIGTMGISMGGYGALLLAEKYPTLIGAVAGISPAIWTSYSQASAVNTGAYAVRVGFRGQRCRHPPCCFVNTPVRIASGLDLGSLPCGRRCPSSGSTAVGDCGVLAGVPHGGFLQCGGTTIATVPWA